MLNLIDEAGASHLVTPAADEVAVLHNDRTHRGRTGNLPRLLSGGLLSTVPLHHRLRLLHDVRKLHRGIGSSATSAITPAQHESTEAYAHRRRFPGTAMSHILDPLNATMTLSDPVQTAATTPSSCWRSSPRATDSSPPPPVPASSRAPWPRNCPSPITHTSPRWRKRKTTSPSPGPRPATATTRNGRTPP
ncbi:hypothetical protein ACQ4WX_41455 [Streptomyces lasalocidi]